MLNSSRILYFAILAVVLSVPIRGEDVHAQPRIIDATLVPQSQFRTIGVITNIARNSFCTGTLIAPRFVLTAAHCVNNQTPGSILPHQKDGLFILNGKTYKTKHIFVHPTYAGDHSQEAEGAIDLAIYELDKDVKNISPTPLYRNTPAVGADLTLAGFGYLGTGSTGYNNATPRRGLIAVGHTPIDIVTNTFIKWNFDNNPANPESNTAPGDSGGPQFITENGLMYVASVTSGGRKADASFGDLSYNTRVDIAVPWIESITGGTPVAGNHAPVITNFAPSAIGFMAGTTVTFTATASDVDDDVLQYHWLFGDGSEAFMGTPTQMHTYASEGTFLAQLVVTDKKGGSAAKYVTLETVTSDPIGTPLTPATFGAKSFSVDLSENESGGALTVNFQSPAFKFASAQAFNAFYKTPAITRLYIGNDEVAALYGINGKTSTAVFKFDYKKGSFQIKISKRLDFLSLLNYYGLQNADGTGVLTLPLRVGIETDIFHAGPKYLYGGDATFTYTARKNVSAKGK